MKSDMPATKVMLIMESWGTGGTETYVAGLTQMIVSKNIDVSLVLLHKGEEERVDFLPAKKVFVTGLGGLASLLRRERPDVVNLHLYTHLLPTMVVCRMLRHRVVATLHMPLKSWGMRHRLYWRLAIRLAAVVVGVSRLVLVQLNTKKVRKEPIPGGVGRQFFACERVRRRSQTDDFAIIAMGRLSVEKDWLTLIEAIALLPQPMRERVGADFYGSGSLQTELEALARERGVRAIFHGYVDKHVLVNALASADLSVLPSRFEGLGLSALEGMAAGVPTITADFAAASDFIAHGVTGHMFPVGNARPLAQWIGWHIDNPADSESIGRAGRDFVQRHFSEEVTYLPYLEIFRQVAR